jgi:SAM-dependent methyltransferase
MDEPQQTTHETDPARSFGQVADAYDRARPSYPTEAAEWMVERPRASVLELGAGTGKLTEHLVTSGHRVLATDPSAPMLRLLRARVRRAEVAQSAAEAIPTASRSVDVVACAQAFHWFDHERAMPEIARVLRPGGVLSLVWNDRDERIPWVRRLGELIGPAGHDLDPTRAIKESELFEDVETKTFRFWQPLTQELLRDVVVSRSNIAVLDQSERARVFRQVDALYDEYGRGADGMLLPYVTRAYRATVKPQQPADDSPAVGPDDLDTDSLLIDFR